MAIKVRIKNVYGNELIYPVCEYAKTFARIANTKTLAHRDIESIRALGFSIHVETPCL